MISIFAKERYSYCMTKKTVDLCTTNLIRAGRISKWKMTTLAQLSKKMVR